MRWTVWPRAAMLLFALACVIDDADRIHIVSPALVTEAVAGSEENAEQDASLRAQWSSRLAVIRVERKP